MHDVQAELPGQVDPLGAPVEHRLRADVDEHPADLGAPQLAADLGRTLQDQHVGAGPGELVRRGQPGQASPDDHHPAHPDTFPDPCRRAGPRAVAGC